MARNLVAAMVDLLFFAASCMGEMCLCLENLQFLDWQPVSLSVEPGEAVCLRGGSGSGKSLLLRAVVDLIPNEGNVRLGDCVRSEVEAPDWRRRVGYLPAEVLWWEDRVGDHFLIAPSDLHFDALNLDRDCLDWHPHRLSMGERQRLGLLRLFDRKRFCWMNRRPTWTMIHRVGSRSLFSNILGRTGRLLFG